MRYRYNPRLLAAARLMPRGTIVEQRPRAGDGQPALAEATIERLRKLRIDRVADCLPGTRCYPLGGLAFHVTGEAVHQTNWAARNASFVERDANATLQGFDDRAHTVEVRLRDGRTHTLIARDYTELLPLMRHKRDPSHAEVRRMLDKPRDVRLTLDGPLQATVAQALNQRAASVHAPGGAAVVVDVATGALLASASYPWPALDESDEAGPPAPAELLDRGRYGLYPPGSTFKLIAAAAALTEEGAARTPTFVCERLQDGRVGAHVRGASRPIRDDLTDKTPHGRVDLRKGLVVSCNAYFAQLAMHLGPQAISRPRRRRRFRSPSTPASLRGTLPYAGYGQGEVLASPLRMARAVAAIAGNGVIHEAALVQPDAKITGDESALAARTRCRLPAQRHARSGDVGHGSRACFAPGGDCRKDRHRRSPGRAVAFVVRRLCPGGCAAHRLCGRGRERRIRRPGCRAARGRHRLGGPRYGSHAMKEIVDRARRLSRTMAGRLRRAVDPPLASDAAPLEIRHFIIESIESRVQPSGGGRRKLPDALVDVKIVAADPAAQRALRTALDDVQSGVLARLKELSCEVPAGFRVQVTYLKRPPSGWPADRQLAIEYPHIQTIETAPSGTPELTLTVTRGSATQESVHIHAADRAGRPLRRAPRRSRPHRRNDVAFLENGDDDSMTVTRGHCEIRFSRAGGGYRVFDERSANGTRIVRNGEIIDVPANDPIGVAIIDGDEIEFGTASVSVGSAARAERNTCYVHGAHSAPCPDVSTELRDGVGAREPTC